MEREATRGRAKAEDLISYHEAFVQAYSGHLQQSGPCHNVPRIWPGNRAGGKASALFQAGAALPEALLGMGRWPGRRRWQHLQLSKDREVEFGAGFALALLGDLCSSSNTCQRSGTAVPGRYFRPIHLHADASRAPGARPERAGKGRSSSYKSPLPYELAAPRSSIHGNFGALYPIYVRGEAYLAEKQGRCKQPRNSRKFSLTGASWAAIPSAPVARLQLGRAYALSGDTPKRKRLTRISSPSGRMQTPISRS